MIGLFPTPFPDELLYSLCARYAARMKYPAKSALIRELLGSPMRSPVVDFPRHLDHLIAVLPPSHRFTLERLLNHHTLLPYFSPFFLQDSQADIVQSMKGGNGAGFYHRFGFFSAGVVWPAWLRFCPLCVPQDTQRFGQPFWRRLHQVPGVLVCPDHRVFLQDSSISPRKHQPNRDFVPADGLIQPTQPIPLKLNLPDHRVLLRIAQDADWLLNQPYSAFSLELFSQRYRYCLAEFFSAYKVSNPFRLQMLDRLQRFYSPALLHRIHCPLDAQPPHLSWVFKLLRPESSHNPLHHLLFIHFLGFSVQQFCRWPLVIQPHWCGHNAKVNSNPALTPA